MKNTATEITAPQTYDVRIEEQNRKWYADQAARSQLPAGHAFYHTERPAPPTLAGIAADSRSAAEALREAQAEHAASTTAQDAATRSLERLQAALAGATARAEEKRQLVARAGESVQVEARKAAETGTSAGVNAAVAEQHQAELELRTASALVEGHRGALEDARAEASRAAEVARDSERRLALAQLADARARAAVAALPLLKVAREKLAPLVADYDATERRLAAVLSTRAEGRYLPQLAPPALDPLEMICAAVRDAMKE